MEQAGGTVRVNDKVIVITGGAGGIGSSLARRFAREGAAAIVLSDLDAQALQATADTLTCPTAIVAADVSQPESAHEIVALAQREFGHVDLFCANAGIACGRGIDASEDDFERAWRINSMAHVYAAQAVLPSMLERGSGYFLNTASAAGLLTTPGDAPYSMSKHAAVAFGEWLAITYGNQGIGVSILCPMGVRTDMLLPSMEQGDKSALAVASAGELLEPDYVAEVVIAGLDEEKLHILPHPEVGTMYANRAQDPNRWARGMRRFFNS